MAIKTIMARVGSSILNFFTALWKNPKSLLIFLIFVMGIANAVLLYNIFQIRDQRDAIEEELEAEREAQQEAIDQALEEAEREWEEQFDDPFSDDPDFEFDFDSPTEVPSEATYEDRVIEREAEIREESAYEIVERFDDGAVIAARDVVGGRFSELLRQRIDRERD